MDFLDVAVLVGSEMPYKGTVVVTEYSDNIYGDSIHKQE